MRKRLLSSVIAIAMAASLSACGGAESTTEAVTEKVTEATTEATTEDPAVKYPANIQPSKIHPGSVNSDEDTSERWYPNGDTSSEISFTLTQTASVDDCVGLAFCLYKTENGVDVDMIDMPLRDGGDGHAITKEFTFTVDKETKYDFDLTFQDNFTCYDFKTDTVWKRSHPDYGCKDQSWYDDAFSGLVAYRDLSSVKYQQIVMNEDHTFVESVTDMDDMTGHWECQASNVLMLIYDNPEDSGVQVIDGSSLLEDGGESGAETTYSDSWQQEFNISADGKVTEFGLFPKYDEEMNLVGYESAFELTTKDELEALEKERQEKAEAAKNAGSPYPVPEVENIMDVNFDAVNLEQEPDLVIESFTYNGDETLKALKNGEYEGCVIEMHGYFKQRNFYVPYSDKESGKLMMTWRVGDVELPGDEVPVVIKGVYWTFDSNTYLFFDQAHLTTVEE